MTARALALILFTVPAFAQETKTLAWDANSEPDIAGYRISVSPEDGEQGEWFEVTATQQSFDLSAGRYIARVTAFNLSGLESEPAELAFEVTATLRLTIQRSTDLTTWEDIYSQTVPVVGPKAFYRLKISAQ